MAESDVLKKEDVDEITDVLQVAPHQKNNQFSAVTKSETGDLVSLDELYEKTGQEAINRFIDGFKELARSNRLSRDHALALNIQGAENWLELPDVYNTRIGKESFFTAVKKGVVAIVKAIIAFVKGVCNWIYTRISSLLGFSRTVNETRFIYEHSEKWRGMWAELIKELGLSSFQTEEFLSTVEKNLTHRELLQLTKSRLDSNETAFQRLQEAQEKISDYTKTINGWNKNLRLAKRAGDANINQLRRLLNQRQPITLSDVGEISAQFMSITNEYLNPEKPTAYLAELTESLYGIEIDGLGIQNDLNSLRTELKTKVDTFKQNYDEESSALVNATIRQIYKHRFDNVGREISIDKNIATQLRTMTDENDAKVIQAVDELVAPEGLTPAYLGYCKSVSSYAESIEMILNIVQRIDKSVVNILKWRTDLNLLVSASLTRDMLELQKAFDQLDPAYSAKVSPYSDLLLDNIELLYRNKSSDMQNAYSLISEIIKQFFRTPDGKEILASYQRHKNRILSA